MPTTVLEITEWSATDRRSTRRWPSCHLRWGCRSAPSRSATLVMVAHTHSLTMLTAAGVRQIEEASAIDWADGLLWSNVNVKVNVDIDIDVVVGYMHTKRTHSHTNTHTHTHTDTHMYIVYRIHCRQRQRISSLYLGVLPGVLSDPGLKDSTFSRSRSLTLCWPFEAQRGEWEGGIRAG
jgi:hypothetical protein